MINELIVRDLNEIRERLGILIARVESNEDRIEKLETTIESDLKSIHSDLKELNAHMNKGKGWGAAFLLLAGLLGALIDKFLGVFKP